MPPCVACWLDGADEGMDGWIDRLRAWNLLWCLQILIDHSLSIFHINRAGATKRWTWTTTILTICR